MASDGSEGLYTTFGVDAIKSETSGLKCTDIFIDTYSSEMVRFWGWVVGLMEIQRLFRINV